MGHKKFLLLILMLAVYGCGADRVPTHPVMGQLRFQDGTFPKMGTIEFYNAEHKVNARGKIRNDGSFTVGTFEKEDGAVAGTHSVAIIQLMSDSLAAKREVVIEIDESEDGAGHDHNHGHDHNVNDVEIVHPKYADYRTSDLSIEIQPGENRITLELQHR
jgi:hypothetical protein